MNLSQLRTEVLNHGFDPNVFTSRVNQYLNDAQFEIARRCDYYAEEATEAIATTPASNMVPFPADFARERSLFDADQNRELQSCTLREIDRSTPRTGRPTFYAIDGANVHLYPTPDGVYNLTLRYWKLPTTLVNDTDTPSLPPDYHRLLWYWAVSECYDGEDDPAEAQHWDQKFETLLSRFMADQKAPDANRPTQAADMWNPARGLAPNGWTLYPNGY